MNIDKDNVVNFEVYPNPFKNKINIKGILDNVFYKMYAAEGKLIDEGKLNNSEIDFVDLPVGIYFLKLYSKDKVQIIKLLKRF